MRKKIEGVAFDLDGTLYPNYRLNIKLIPFILKDLRLVAAFGRARSIIRKEQKTAVIPDFYQHQAAIVAKILKAPQELIKEKLDILIYRGWEPLFKKIKLFSHVQDILGAFHSAGLKLGLLSDFPPEKKLEYLGISGIWDAVLCSEQRGALKPHVLPFNDLASAMSLNPENIIYVGNSRLYDVAGARLAGMQTAWLKPVFFPGKGIQKPLPDFTFNNYRQLYDFVINLSQ
jgi:putative hydrolase of the HAD superfamily